MAIVFSMLPLKVSHEKAYNGNGQHEIFIHMHTTGHYRCAATVRKLPTATAPASRAAVGTDVRALNGRSRAAPEPPGQTQAEARKGQPTNGRTRGRQRPAPQRGSRSRAAPLTVATAWRRLSVHQAC